jgi:hypothetical protein
MKKGRESVQRNKESRRKTTEICPIDGCENYFHPIQKKKQYNKPDSGR